MRQFTQNHESKIPTYIVQTLNLKDSYLAEYIILTFGNKSVTESSKQFFRFKSVSRDLVKTLIYPLQHKGNAPSLIIQCAACGTCAAGWRATTALIDK